MAVKDKVVVVTGGARGMGGAYVRGFLAQGAKVAAVDRSWEPTGFSGDKDDSFRKELEARGDALVLTADISDGEQVQEAYKATMAKFGTVDVLVNNAGMRSRDLFPPTGRSTTLQTKDSDFERMYAVNVFGTLKVTRQFAQPMLEKRRGSIMSVVSSGLLLFSRGGGYEALRPNSREQPYMSSKAAVANVMFYMADELREYNVACNIIIPGHTRTTGFDEQNAARAARGGRPGPEPVRGDHVVPLALFLAEQDVQSGITGKAFDAMVWNIEHGHGGQAAWADRGYVPG